MSHNVFRLSRTIARGALLLQSGWRDRLFRQTTLSAHTASTKADMKIRHVDPLLSLKIKRIFSAGNNIFKRSVATTTCNKGGPQAVPGTSAPSAAVVPTSYGYLSDMVKSIVTKVENPFSYIYGTTKQEPVKVVPKSEQIQKAAEERISRSEVTARTKTLIAKFSMAETNESKITRIKELSDHLIAYPPTRVIAAQDPVAVAELLKLVLTTTHEQLREEARACLTMIGIQPPPKSKGISVLSIDGGGTRGMMGLEVLEQLEKESGKKICELFDMICGVSTGGIIAALLTVKKFTVKECREMYLEVSKKLFSQGKFQGSFGLLTQHSYYNTQLWMNLLKEIIGEDYRLIDASRVMETPRLAIIASVVNLPAIQPYVFRNYEHPAGRDSHYPGGAGHYLWTAVQASAAAPLYFAEVKLGKLLLQDGGVFANNPTAIAMHEAKLLWPDENIHCVVSVGNGRNVSNVEPNPSFQSTSFQHKLMRIIDSATDTEGVHMCMHDMLQNNVYYRLNPYMTNTYGLDEIDPERLEAMKNDAKLYVRRNAQKISLAAERLTEKPTLVQAAQRWLDEKKNLHGFYVPS